MINNCARNFQKLTRYKNEKGKKYTPCTQQPYLPEQHDFCISFSDTLHRSDIKNFTAIVRISLSFFKLRKPLYGQRVNFSVDTVNEFNYTYFGENILYRPYEIPCWFIQITQLLSFYSFPWNPCFYFLLFDFWLSKTYTRASRGVIRWHAMQCNCINQIMGINEW